MDEQAQEAASRGEKADDSRWLRDGHHVSEGNFDLDASFWADVEAPKDKAYLNQHVFNGKYSYFGKLVTKDLTKIINVPVLKNAGATISMAAKNLAYGSICNTGRLHKPLFFETCTQVLAFPPLRDKVVLHVLDGLIGQYEGGPEPAAQHQWACNTLYIATDPFAMDRTGYALVVEKRKENGLKVNESPTLVEWFSAAEKLGLGIGDPARIQVVRP
jgi:hypothetical protein